MSRVESRESRAVRLDETFDSRPSTLDSRHAFSLVEVLVVVTLLSLIVLALMAVFNTTQRAFRASITQTDVLEGGRATMDLITADLRAMSPSLGYSNGAVNFYANLNLNYQPLAQSLVASSQQRTNVLENFFILSKGNLNGVPSWFGTGYMVVTNTPDGSPYALYRFSTNHPVMTYSDPGPIFYTDFGNFFNAPTNYSHLMDGVLSLTVRAYDNNGYWMTNTYNFADEQTNKNIQFLPVTSGEVGFYMYSNSLPSAVEIQLGVLEDRTLQRAESRLPGSARDQYVQLQSGKLHIFRQRVLISNVDPTAYQ
jgi:prepilin-type N-terminal cleavage/methylation domain-containing protein